MTVNNTHQAVREFFDRQVDSYADNFAERKSGRHFIFHKRIEAVRSLCAGSSGSILDCATGTGHVTAAALSAGRFKEADLIDLSPAMIARARQQIAPGDCRLSFVESDIFDFLKSCRKEYNLILCIGLLAHTGRLDELLTLLRPRMKAGGRILLHSSLLNNAGYRLVRRLTSNRHIRQKGYSISDYYLAEIEASARRAGLIMEQQIRFGLNFPFGDRIFPGLNFLLEKTFDRRSSRNGAEIIMALVSKS